MKFVREHVGDVLVVTIPKLTSDDLFRLSEVEDELANIIQEEEAKAVLVDLSNIDFAATPLLSALVRMHLEAKRQNRRFALCCPTDFVREVLRNVRLDTLFRVFPSREVAVRDIKGQDNSSSSS